MKNANEFGEYTSWSGRKTFKEEKNLVIEALEENESKLKEYLMPLVRYWGEGFQKKLRTNLTDEELAEAGFMHLNLALRNYYEKLEKGKVGFKFSTYFEWFIRQGFLDYLNREKEE